MNSIRFLAASLLVAITSVTFASEISITRYDVLQADHMVLDRSERTDSLVFSAGGHSFDIKLSVNHRLSDQLPSSSRTTLYSGQLSDQPESWVRFSERDGIFRGLIFDGENFYAIEDGNNKVPGKAKGSGLIFYALKDAIIEPGSMSCGSNAHSFSNKRTLQGNAEKVSAELRERAKATATQSIDIAVIGDSLFAADHSADPAGALMDRLNLVDGYFSDQVGVTLNVTEFRVLDAADDPFTTDDASDLLDPELTDYKFDDPALRPLGLVHLYTGRNLDGTTVGIAFRNALCSSRFGAGLSEGRRGLNTDSLIAAHEFGHNFGAPHDGDADEACASTSQTFIMAPSINGSSTFSDCSLNQIQQEVASASCLTAIATIDVLPVFANFPTSTAVGSDFNGTVRARNNGSDTASNVVLDLTVPAGLSLDQSSLPAGCTVAGAGASCSIASLLSGEQRSFTFTFTATSSGDATISAETTASGDGNATNDQATQIIDVQPVVDLAATLNSPLSFETGTTSTITIGASNNSADAATNVSVVLNASSFLTIVSAANGCSINGTTVNCSDSVLAANSSNNFDIEVEGANLGSTTISVTVDGSEPDSNSGNNTASQSISVVDPGALVANLAATISGPSSLDTNASGTYTVTIQNNGADPAESTTATIDMPATIRPDSADSGCQINGATITCDLGSLAAAASQAISIGATATSTGSNSISVTAETSTTDSDTANNSASLAVTVSDPPPPPPPPSDSDSGGGSLNLYELLALLLSACLIWRRRRVAAHI